MAQAVTTIPAAASQVLIQTTPTPIAGLNIAVLNGSGWVELFWSIVCASSYNGANLITLYPTIDGVPIPNSTAKLTLLQNITGTVARKILIKPGAGQHVYQLVGFSAQVTVTLDVFNANFSLEEPGY
jgi:hypothetical protein